MTKIYTCVYWPEDPAADGRPFIWTENDHTEMTNNFAPLNGPSFSVRMIVFEMPED